MLVELDGLAQRRVLLWLLEHGHLARAPGIAVPLLHGTDDGSRVDPLVDVQADRGNLEAGVLCLARPDELWVEVRVVLVDLPGQIRIGRRRDQAHGRVVHPASCRHVRTVRWAACHRLTSRPWKDSLSSYVKNWGGQIVAYGIGFPLRAADCRDGRPILADRPRTETSRLATAWPSGLPVSRATSDCLSLPPSSSPNVRHRDFSSSRLSVSSSWSVLTARAPAIASTTASFGLPESPASPNCRRQIGESRPCKSLQYPPSLHHITVRGQFNERGKTRHEDPDPPPHHRWGRDSLLPGRRTSRHYKVPSSGLPGWHARQSFSAVEPGLGATAGSRTSSPQRTVTGKAAGLLAPGMTLVMLEIQVPFLAQGRLSKSLKPESPMRLS